MIVFIAMLFLIWFTGSACAHVAVGADILIDRHWRWDVGFVLAFFAGLYLRGWIRLRKIGGEAGAPQLLFYTLALGAVACALLSPIDELASYLLIAHMVQHELLMMVAPPLILLANPVPVLLWGFGERWRLQAGSLLARNSIVRQVR